MRPAVDWRRAAAACFDPWHRGGHGSFQAPGNGCPTPAVAADHLSPEGAALPLMNTHTKGSSIMNSTPQVATAEISDADLDAVSGGLGLDAVGTVTGIVDSVAPGVLPLVGSVVGTVEGLTGLNVTGVVAGL